MSAKIMKHILEEIHNLPGFTLPEPIDKRSWIERFAEYKAFQNLNQFLHNKRSKNSHESSLEHWARVQRDQKEQSKLSSKQITLLESIPGWKWKRDLHKMWKDRFTRVLFCTLRDGKIPSNKSSSNDKEIITLGNWIHEQKCSKRGTRVYIPLTKEQISLLESIPGWSWNHDSEKDWFSSFEKAKRIVKQLGKFPKEGTCKKEHRPTACWLRVQSLNRKERGTKKLTTKQMKLLDTIPGWAIDRQGLWKKQFDEVVSFRKSNGTFPPVASKLGNWISVQKAGKKSTGWRKLSQERIDLLESIPGWVWEVDLGKKWQDKYREVEAFLKNNKYPSQDSKALKERSLHHWIEGQKRKKRGNVRGELTQSQIKLLERLPNWKW